MDKKYIIKGLGLRIGAGSCVLWTFLFCALLALVWAGSAHGDAGPVAVPNLPGPALPSDTVVSSAAIGYLGGSGSISPTGEYTWSLPLWVPTGRGGLKPELSIQYGSRGGNGILGVGFSLGGLSAITRCGQNKAIDDVTRGVDYSQEDRFCLDGERLVLVNGGYGASGSEYRTERESYKKILFSEGNLFEPGSFEVFTKAGQMLLYTGIRANRAKPSPITPHDLQVVEQVDVLWALSRVEDRSGNKMEIHYQVIGNDDPTSFKLEVLPDSILYGKRSVHFVYEPRLDPSFSWLSGVKISSTRILNRIEMHAPNPNSIGMVQSYEFSYQYSATTHRSLLHTISRCDFEHTCLWAKEFLWNTGNRPEFETIDLPQHSFLPQHFDLGFDTGFVVLDMDGDGSDEILYRKAGDYFVGRNDPNTKTPLGIVTPLNQANTSGPGGEWFREIDLTLSRPFDINGDGAMELLGAQWIIPEAYLLFQWDKNSQTPRHTDAMLFVSMLQIGQSQTFAALHAGDLDGDGLSDLMLQEFIDQTNSQWAFLKNAGAIPFSGMLTQAPAFWGSQAKVVDMDGDGRAEVMNADSPGKHGTNMAGLNPDGSVHIEPVLDVDYLGRNALWADINGDGIRDIVRPSDLGGLPGWVRFGTGTGYDERQLMLNGPWWDGNAGGDKDRGTWAVDINGDGRDDFVCFRIDPWPSTWVFLSNGDGTFVSKQIFGMPGTFHIYEGFSTSRIGDFNGDGLIDLVMVENGILRVLQQTPGPVDVVTEVGDQFVGEVPREKILYSEHWSDAPGPASCVFPQRCIKHGMTVAREHWVWQGERVDAYHKRAYEYQDPRMDMHGRGFLGFGKVIETDLDRWSRTITAYDHETSILGRYPYAGLPKTVEHIAPIFEEAPNVFPFTLPARRTVTTNHYIFKPKNQWVSYSAELSTSTTEEYELSVQGSEPAVYEIVQGSEVLKRERHSAQLTDDYGNVLSEEHWMAGGEYQKTSNYYANDPNTWTLGLLADRFFVSSKDGVNPLPAPKHTQYVYDTKGLLRQVKIEPNGLQDSQKLTTTLVRDGDGLVTQVIQETPGLPVRNRYIAYEDTERIFPTATWNDMGWMEQYRYHPGLGVPAVTWDMYAVETKMQYDGFGRLVHTERAGEPSVDVGMDVSLNDNFFVNGLIVQASSSAGDAYVSLIDEWGRPVEQYEKSFDGQWSISKQRYDVLGRMVEAHRPDIGAPSSYSGKMFYDSLDRLVRAEGPDGATSLYTYSFFEAMHTDPDGHVQKQIFDMDGRVKESIDVLQGMDIVTSYHWGDFGQIHEVIDHAQNVTSFLYDQRGRRVLLSDPDRGISVFGFNGFDELVWEKNTLNEETSYARDGLGRVTDVVHTADGVTHFEWDTHLVGQLASAISPDGVQRDFWYDDLGRLQESAYLIAGDEYKLGYWYDSHGRIGEINYPEVPGRARFGVSLVYNANDFLEQVQDKQTGEAYWTVQERNADGALKVGRYGKHLQQDRSYDLVTGRLEAIQTGNGTLIDSLSYKYYPGGDVMSRDDAVTGRNEAFVYDDIGRLKTWTLSAQGNSRETAYVVNAIGNITGVLLNGVSKEQNGYGINNTKPHALTSGVKGTYTYDDMGRMTLGGGRSIAYTAFDLPSSVTQNNMTTVFAYDAFHERVRKTGPLGDTVFVGELYERRENPSGFEHVFFVPGEFGPAAEVHIDGNTLEEEVRYLPGDALGSMRVLTDEKGDELERAYFDPYGRRVDEGGTPIAANASPATHWGFTGYLHDDDLGLIHARGRTYDPVIRRFLTPDPVVPDPLFGQAFNRYSYGFGNPLRYTDPSGFEPPNCIENNNCHGGFRLGFDINQSAIDKSQQAANVGAGSKKTPAARADSDGAKPVTGAASDSDPRKPEAKEPVAVPNPNPPSTGGSIDKVYGTGLMVGTLQGAIPLGTMVDGVQQSAGVGYQGPPRYQLGKATGQVIGGLALMFFGAGGTVGGAGLNLTGIGAVIGLPAMAVSTGLVAAGAENTLAGVMGMWQALSSGGVSGPVAQGPAAPAPGAGPKPPAPPGSNSKLAKAMRGAGMQQPANTEAHHIVAQHAKLAERAREILQKFNIDIDDPVNGVFLPANKSSPNPNGFAVHRSLHTGDYYRAVEEALSTVKTREKAIEVLGIIRQKLQNGGYP